VSWSVVLTGSRDDVRRLAEEFPNFVPVEGSEHELLLALSGTDAAAAQAEADAFVERVNGFGRFQWGRTFDGLSVGVYKSIGLDGGENQTVVLGAAHAHLSPEEFADMVERLGHPRPEPPRGLEHIRALRGGQVVALASVNSSVAHALKLVDRMLVGDEQIDWAAAYSAMETIDEDLRSHCLGGRDLGWWTRKERTRFDRTANSVHILGSRSRHSRRRVQPPPDPMRSTEASWFVRAAVARWIAWLIEQDE
jgi:hypothetical protein